ncbi:MAG: hypothetical protein QXY87_09600 [Saccharolobus sp.]|uniref:hypothetical protein n=1 Tax=Saccharolobus TaxID=2100760 RepID=UPI001F1099DB|nr:hypothetical protein [Saccharolobus shibatae]MCH4815789.1 hypothetical protein [Saccharolobus shibatae]
MCEKDEEIGIMYPDGGTAEDLEEDPKILELRRIISVNPTLDGVAEYLVSIPQQFKDYASRNQTGFVRYGDVKPGSKVLIAASNLHDREIINALVKALKKKGASVVDIIILDDGEDRELTYYDEIERIIRTEPWWIKPRWYDYQEKILNYAKDNGYDLLIHGRGGPIPKTNAKGEILPYNFEAFPWQSKDAFLSRSTIFPAKLNYLINVKTWKMIYDLGKGGKVRLTDPEGTELEFTLHEKYYNRTLDERGGFGPRPALGHLFGHPTPPIISEEDAVGVIAGTTSHLTRPFPQIRIYVENGRIEKIEGGGPYGEAWKKLHEETLSVKYPEFPDKGLFWLWEMAIGTNPKVRRPSNVLMLSGTNEVERSRSGVIHVGFGTRWRGESERWAAAHGIPFGHLHIHLLFPTYEIKTITGQEIRVIDNGHLTVLDDPEVRELAKKYGDPEELLKEDWIPKIPGINVPGKYEDYAKDPAEWIKQYNG